MNYECTNYLILSARYLIIIISLSLSLFLSFSPPSLSSHSPLSLPPSISLPSLSFSLNTIHLGTVILKHTEALLRCYTVYCVNYDDATTALVKFLKKKNEFRKWHDKVCDYTLLFLSLLLLLSPSLSFLFFLLFLTKHSRSTKIQFLPLHLSLSLSRFMTHCVRVFL